MELFVSSFYGKGSGLFLGNDYYSPTTTTKTTTTTTTTTTTKTTTTTLNSSNDNNDKNNKNKNNTVLLHAESAVEILGENEMKVLVVDKRSGCKVIADNNNNTKKHKNKKVIFIPNSKYDQNKDRRWRRTMLFGLHKVIYHSRRVWKLLSGVDPLLRSFRIRFVIVINVDSNTSIPSNLSENNNKDKQKRKLSQCCRVHLKQIYKVERSKYNLSHRLNRSLHYIHITKTAGTFVEDLGVRCGYLWGKYDTWYMKNVSEHFTEIHPFPKKMGNGTSAGKPLYHSPYLLECMRDEFSNVCSSSFFTIVRNPYDRLLSELRCKYAGVLSHGKDKKGWSNPSMTKFTNAILYLTRKLIYTSSEDFRRLLESGIKRICDIYLRKCMLSVQDILLMRENSSWDSPDSDNNNGPPPCAVEDGTKRTIHDFVSELEMVCIRDGYESIYGHFFPQSAYIPSLAVKNGKVPKFILKPVSELELLRKNHVAKCETSSKDYYSITIYLIRFEKLNKELDTFLKNTIGLPIEKTEMYPKVNVSSNQENKKKEERSKDCNHNTPDLVLRTAKKLVASFSLSDCSNRTIQLADQLYANDFRMFGYKMNK